MRSCSLPRRLSVLLTFMIVVLPAQLSAAGGGGGKAIVFVADSRRLTGLWAWFTNLYNESLAYFTLLTVICIPLLALLLSTVMGFILSRTGIDLKSRAVAGH
ncbi:MAG: hypothetical protein GY953_06895 [bacterium]|nr:hypothetical protein [bacterium]